MKKNMSNNHHKIVYIWSKIYFKYGHKNNSKDQKNSANETFNSLNEKKDSSEKNIAFS